MKQPINEKRFLAAALLTSAIAVPVAGAVPQAPQNLEAEVQGTIVNLSWDNIRTGAQTGVNDFENAFPGDGWSVRTRNTNDPCFTWFQYPTDNYTSAENWQTFIHEFPEARHIFQGLSFCLIKEKVKQIVADELERIANDENRKHLLQQK